MLGELGRRLELARRQRGFSQEELAQRAGVGVATLRRIEDGKDARLGSWLRLFAALDLVTAVELLLPEEQRSPMADVRGKRRRRPGQPADGADFVWGDERG